MYIISLLTYFKKYLGLYRFFLLYEKKVVQHNKMNKINGLQLNNKSFMIQNRGRESRKADAEAECADIFCQSDAINVQHPSPLYCSSLALNQIGNTVVTVQKYSVTRICTLKFFIPSSYLF